MGAIYKGTIPRRGIPTPEDNANLHCVLKSATYVAGNGKNEVFYELDYEATMIVMTGYDVVARAKVIKRWQELEKIAKCEQQSHFKPNEQPETIDWTEPVVINRFSRVKKAATKK